MNDSDELREDIKKECEEAIRTKQLPKIDVELKHVYVEIFWYIMARDRFITDPEPIYELLNELGEVEVVYKRKEGRPIICNW